MESALRDEKYKIPFSPEQIATFGSLTDFGCTIQEMPAFLNMTGDERKRFVSEGKTMAIPTDSTNNQLKDWIYTARQANIELGKEKDLDFAIKGDAKQEYPKIKKIMDILQDQKINSFNLVTGMRGKDF